jgi:hypothetical protein
MTGADAIRRRRDLITGHPHPGPHHECLVTLTAPLAAGLALSLRYVPDRTVLDAPSWDRYTAALDPADAPETLAVAVLDDINNELVPRWVQVVVERTHPTAEAGAPRHHVVVEDAQPDWIDNGILARL